jgi:hypothetical protein
MDTCPKCKIFMDRIRVTGGWYICKCYGCCSYYEFDYSKQRFFKSKRKYDIVNDKSGPWSTNIRD